mgnify:CR=1 FL=1|tara:strand:- start:231 stop:689 length:459 start_codon:yes stop_codon:yes gene_type:complete
MYIKKNARVTFRSNKRSNFKRNNNFTNNKFRNKGNVTQMYNKYLKLAKEASSTGDRIQSEYYYQFTDHYYRIMVEMGISIEDNNDSSSENVSETNNSDKEVLSDSKKENIENNEDHIEDNAENNDDIESIESIPFISEPAKKKTTRGKKASA